MEHYQELFNHLYDNHGLILLQGEMDEIVEIASRLNNSCGEDEAQAVRPNEQTKEVCELCMGNGVIESDWDGGGFTAKCDCKAN